MSETIREYYGDGYVSNKVAQEVGPEIERLALANNGQLTAADLLEASKAKASPLHKHLNWNDKEAATLYRLDQCRTLLRDVKIRIVQSGEVVQQGPILLCVRREEPTSPVMIGGVEHNFKPYVLVERVREDEIASRYAVEEAVRYLMGARKRLSETKALLADNYPSVIRIYEGLEDFAREAEANQADVRKAA